MLLDKWQFNISQDWEIPRNDFDSISSEIIPDITLWALGFYYSPLSYLEERASQFIDVTDKSELTIKLEDNSQPITDFKDEKARKGLENVAKRKTWYDNLYAPLRQAFTTGSVAFLSFHLPILTLLSRLPLPVLLSCLGSPKLFYSLLPNLLSCPLVPTLSSASIPALFSYSMLGLTPTYFTSSVFKIF